MILVSHTRFCFFLGLPFLLVLSACAPQNSSPVPDAPSTGEPAESAGDETTFSDDTTESGGTIPEEETEPVEETDGADSIEVPDWEKRYEVLYTKYAEEFKGPETGDAIRVELKDGTHQPGWVHRVSDEELVLDTGAGYSTFRLEDLSKASAMATLRSAYAGKNAYDQARKEYETWEQANPDWVQPTPTPNPAPRPTPTPEPVPAESNDGNGLPFVVESNGRVPHVEEYIRKNAAFPDSLNIRRWWPVKPHDRGGYQVRVRYTLKSAGNLGTSYEDMIFFMYSNGRIHQRAPVK